MEVLNSDLQSLRQKINQWLGEYHTTATETHRQQQRTEVQQLLSAIVTLDQDTIRQQAEST